MDNGIKLTGEQTAARRKILLTRFENNTHHHKSLNWPKIKTKILANPQKYLFRNVMEEAGECANKYEIISPGKRFLKMTALWASLGKKVCCN